VSLVVKFLPFYSQHDHDNNTDAQISAQPHYFHSLGFAQVADEKYARNARMTDNRSVPRNILYLNRIS